MHNNIMAASSRDRPPMLATGRYAQWRLRFLRYIEYRTKVSLNGSAFSSSRKCVKPSKGLTTSESLNIQMSRQTYFVSICQITSPRWKTIDLTTQPEWSRFVTIVKQQHKLDEVSYQKLFDILKQYQKEVNELHAERMAKNANPLALVATAQTLQDTYYQSSKSHKSYAPTSKASLPTRSHATTRHKGKEIAKPITPLSELASKEDSDPEQAQRDKDMQKNLALIAKYFKKIYKPINNNLRTSSNTRNKNVDTTPRYKNDNQSGQFGNQKAGSGNVRCDCGGTGDEGGGCMMAMMFKDGDGDGGDGVGGGQVVQQSRIQCFNCKEFGHYAKECRKPKRVKDSTYHKERWVCCLKQAEKGVQQSSRANLTQG
ncbi:integrase, catalytic region, zinc finger, CCHC-type containing protein [Tanacetum coccineum]|uniref:Integrase, catalytic region, zinc finger, CCHC-type containing protein n=1 Tax=Tanacetum coccineum TaxID=301880 RepID=A0ABQ5EGJ6_9ASTR